LRLAAGQQHRLHREPHRRGTIGEKDWYEVGGGESGWIAARADDPDIVYAGSYSYLSRLDVRTGQERISSRGPTIRWAGARAT